MTEEKNVNSDHAQRPPLAEPEAVVSENVPDDAAEPALPQRQFCIFRAGRERFCLDVLDVEEVVDWPPMTRMPLAPAFLMGVFNLRGAIVPVIDIGVGEGRRADLPPKRVVVANLPAEGDRGGLRLGIAADEVIGTFASAEPLLVEEAPRGVPHCCGMLRHPSTPMAVGSVTVERQDDRLALAINLKRLVETFPIPVI